MTVVRLLFRDHRVRALVEAVLLVVWFLTAFSW